MECKPQAVETGDVAHGLTPRARLRLATALLRRQREILAIMMAERAQRVEAAAPERWREVGTVWSRAVRQQALMVKRMAAEVARLDAEAQGLAHEESGGYAA